MPGGGGYSRFQVTEDDRRTFLGLKFLIPKFFWVAKFGKYFFLGGEGGWLDLSGDFLGYSTQSGDSL